MTHVAIAKKPVCSLEILSGRLCALVEGGTLYPVPLELVVKGLSRNSERLDRPADIAAIAGQRLPEDLRFMPVEALG